jgi:hypothetical protein
MKEDRINDYRRPGGPSPVARPTSSTLFSSPVKTSPVGALPAHPRQAGQKYTESWTQREKHLVTIKSRLDWTLDEEHASLSSLVCRLQRHSIKIVRPPANGRNPHDQIFVDHQMRTTVIGEYLGLEYMTNAFDAAIASRQRPAKPKRRQAKLH